MLEAWKKARQLGVAIPREIEGYPGAVDWYSDRMRAFVWDYSDAGRRLLEAGEYAEAWWVLTHVLELDTNDHMGAVYYAVDCAFQLGRYVAVVHLCERHLGPLVNDPYLEYALLLAAFNVSEPNEELLRELARVAIERQPHFAKLVTQKKKRARYDVGRSIISGSAEEAQSYWNRQGAFWQRHPEALSLLREEYSKAKRRVYTRARRAREGARRST